MEKLLELDSDLLVSLNNLGSTRWDGFWELMTDKIAWLPLYALILTLLIIRFKNWKLVALAVVLVALLITVIDQSLTEFFKPVIKRLRPCYEASVLEEIRMVLKSCGGRYGFFSAHAANSAALAAFSTAALRKQFRYFPIVAVLYSFLHGYSRIYLAKHYPLDVITGWIYGAIIGLLFFALFQFISKKWLSHKS